MSENLQDEYDRLKDEREALIRQGVSPDLLAVPVDPTKAVPTVTGPVHDAPTLKQVAWKGAVQTFLIGMAVDVALAIAFAILAGLDQVTTVEGLVAFLIAVGKSIVMAVARYFVRTLVDRSGYGPDGTPKPVG